MASFAGTVHHVTGRGGAVRHSVPGRSKPDLAIAVPALAIGGTILAGMALNVSALTTVGALAAIGVAVVAPGIGLATIAFMGTFQPPLVIPAPGFNAVLVAAALLGCVYRLPIDRPRIRLTAPILLLTGFVLYVGMQQTPEMIAGYAGGLGYQVYSSFRELLTGFGTVVVAAYVLTRRSPFAYLSVGLVAAILSAIVAIATFGIPAVSPLLVGLTGQSGAVGRAVGTFGNPNYFGVYQAIATVTAVGLLVNARSLRLRALFLAASLVLGAALLVSMSRGGMITLAAGLACLTFSRSRLRVAVAITAALVLTAVVVFPLFVDWRLTITAGSSSAASYALQTESDDGRLAALLAGPQLFLTSPVFGIGWGHYMSMSSQVTGPGFALVAHNWYVSVLAELGAVGIVMWALLLGTLVITLRSRPTFPQSMGLGVLGSYAVGSILLEAPTSFQTSILAIIVIIAALASYWPAQLGSAQPPDRNADPDASHGLVADLAGSPGASAPGGLHDRQAASGSAP